MDVTEIVRWAVSFWWRFSVSSRYLLAALNILKNVLGICSLHIICCIKGSKIDWFIEPLEKLFLCFCTYANLTINPLSNVSTTTAPRKHQLIVLRHVISRYDAPWLTWLSFYLPTCQVLTMSMRSMSPTRVRRIYLNFEFA